ncbi:hypothetical protein Tco_0551760 [Tanacetum coccineum]
MALELADRLVAHLKGVAEDVFVKTFLRTERALIDVHGEELMLRVDDEAIKFKVGHTSRYSRNYYDEMVHQVNVIDVACEEYAQEVLGFLDSSTSGNLTPSDPIIASSSPSLLGINLHKNLSTESSPMSDIEIIDPILERFTDEPAHVYSPPLGDDDDDNDDLFTTSLLDLPTDLVPIPRESEDTFEVNKECDLPFSVTFSNPLFDFNDDFISSNDESLSEEDVQKKILKFIRTTPLLNLIDENISNECFDPGGDIDEINAFLDMDVSTDIEDGYYDSEGDIIYLKSLLINDTILNLPPEVFLDHNSRSLKDEPDNNDLKSMVKVFDPGIHETIISLTYVRLPFEDHYYLSLTFVIKIFLPFLTYLMNSLLFLSSRSEDTIFDLSISAYSFYSLEPVAYESPMMIFLFFYFCPKDKGIRVILEDSHLPVSCFVDCVLMLGLPGL